MGDVWVESCSFENICTDRKDRERFLCEETVGKIFKKKVQFSIVDQASCKGLAGVRCTADSGENAVDGKQQIWMAAYEKGLVTERAMEVMREGVSFDKKDRCWLQKRISIGQFLLQPNTNLHTLNKSSPLMIPAEFTDRVNDLIHLPERHPIHLPVELVEVRTDLFVVIGIVFVVALVEHGEDRLAIAAVGWIGFYVGFQKFKIRFQGNTSQKFWVMLP